MAEIDGQCTTGSSRAFESEPTGEWTRRMFPTDFKERWPAFDRWKISMRRAISPIKFRLVFSSPEVRVPSNFRKMPVGRQGDL